MIQDARQVRVRVSLQKIKNKDGGRKRRGAFLNREARTGAPCTKPLRCEAPQARLCTRDIVPRPRGQFYLLQGVSSFCSFGTHSLGLVLQGFGRRSDRYGGSGTGTPLLSLLLLLLLFHC